MIKKFVSIHLDDNPNGEDVAHVQMLVNPYPCTVTLFFRLPGDLADDIAKTLDAAYNQGFTDALNENKEG